MEEKEVMLVIAKHLRALSDDLLKMTGDDKPETVSKKTTKAKAEEPKPEPEKKITCTEVRTLLADKSRAGHREQVKELLKKYGGTKLSDIKQEDYAALMKDAGEIADA